MKQLLYHIIACCVAVLFFAACDKECDIPGGNVVGDGNSIILDLSSGAQPVSRATATGAEVKVNHIDVLIFDENGSKKHHERVGGSETGSGTIILTAKRSGFAKDAKYEVHLIANSTADVSVFAADNFDKTKLWGMTQEDWDINMTGHPGMTDVPQTFLMDGIAYLEGAENTTLVVLNDGNKSEDTKLKATLRRAAAKLVIRINKGEFVEFNYTSSNSGYYFRNMPYSTSVVTDGGAEAVLRTPTLANNEYFKWTQDVEDGPYTLITVTGYAYAHSWKTGSTLENETRLIVNIPMTTIRHNEAGDYLDANGDITEDVTQAAKDVHDNSFYQIPVCRGTELERNTCYQVSLELNIPGGTDPRQPVELKDVAYDVRAWDEKTINIGGEQDRPEYLTLNEEEFEMHNMTKDNTTLKFSSSSEVTATITKVYYIDKFGQEQKLEKRYPDDPTSNVWGVKTTTTSGRPPQTTTTWSNECEIRITPDEGINGKIDVFGTVPENNAVRYIEFTVTNETGQTRSVTVAQYPLEYITNVVGWYSTRSDFGGTTYENQGTDRYVTAMSYNNGTETWRYSKNESGFFRAMYVDRNSNGTSDIRYYRWVNDKGNNTNTVQNAGSSGKSNSRMYHVQITASSGTYTLGKPRITEGITDPGKDNAELVSPSFMIASQLGAVFSSYLSSDYEDGIDMAASHCKEYVEVAKDGTVYDDWRLPTKAEIEIIARFQRVEGSAVDVVLAGRNYYSASEIVDLGQGSSGTFLRCIRDAYDDKK